MRKLLVVLLALTLVFAFAGAALAAVTVTYGVTGAAQQGTSNDYLGTASSVTITATVTGAPAGSTTTFTYKLNGGAPTAPTTSPFDVSGLLSGKYTVEITATNTPTEGDPTTDTQTLNFYIGDNEPTFGVTNVRPVKDGVTNGSDSGDEDGADDAFEYHVKSDCTSAIVKFSKEAGDRISVSGATFVYTGNVPTALEGNITVNLTGGVTQATATVTVTPESGYPDAVETYTITIVKDYELAGVDSLACAGKITSVAIDHEAGTITGNYYNNVSSLEISGDYTGETVADGPATYENATEGVGADAFTGADGAYGVTLTPAATPGVIKFDITVTAFSGASKTYHVTLNPVSNLNLAGRVYESNSTSASTDYETFSFTTSVKTDMVNVPSSWDIEVDEDDVYLWLNQNVESVRYSSDDEIPGDLVTADLGTGLYPIPMEEETMYVTIKLAGVSAPYRLTIKCDDSIITVQVYDSDKKNPESVTFTSTNKSVSVDEDWDNDDVFLKFNDSVSNVEYAYSSNASSSNRDDAEKSGSYYEVPLDGDTYVWFKYEGKTYRLTIEPDGSASTDLLIDSIEANSEDDGDDYLAFFDNDGGKIYIFRPYSNRNDDIWVNIEADYDVCYNGDDDNEEGEWVEVKGGDTVTVDDEEFDIVVYTGKSSADDDADLDSLSVKAGTKSSNLSTVSITPSFSSGTSNYTAGIGDNTYAQITAKLSDSFAYMIINGYGLYHTSSAKSWTLSGLSTKTNTFKYTIYVIAEDCEEYETYTVTLNRSGSTALKSLSLSGGTLTPSFAAGTRSYTAYTSGSSTTISATAENSSASVTIYGYSAANASLGSQSGTGSAYGTFNLAEGLNTFTVTVSRAGTTATTYYVSVYRIPSSPKILVSKQSISVNGTSYNLAAYNINGNNFVKLRDLAALLMNTNKRFSVDFSDSTQTATMVSGANYTKRGDELTALPAYRKYTASSQRFILDGSYIYPMAFNIDGTNYVMIRDMGSAMNFYVGYTASTKTIVINTSGAYVPN